MDHESPRLQGIREHLERVQLLFRLAHELPDSSEAYRLLITTVYSCRAIIELMLESAEKQELKSLQGPKPKVNRDKLEHILRDRIQFYSLIERIRIHDFHRFGIVPPAPSHRPEIMYGGPIVLTTGPGTGDARIDITPSGPCVSETDSASVKLQRPLLTRNGEFFDEDSQEYMSIESIVSRYIEVIPEIISEFQKDLKEYLSL